MPSPVWRTAASERANRHASAISDQITAEVSAPMPYSSSEFPQPRLAAGELDELAAPRADMSLDHPEQVAAWLAEVFGGPAFYSSTYGGYPRMISQHVGKKLTEAQRARWVMLLVRSAAEAGLPQDAEFRRRVQRLAGVGVADRGGGLPGRCAPVAGYAL
jgi:hypothetical protein